MHSTRLRRYASKAPIYTERTMVKGLQDRKKMWSDCLDTMIKPDSMLAAITTDSWTSEANETYVSLTMHLIDEDFTLISMPFDCVLLEGQTKAEDVVARVTAMCSARGIIPRVGAPCLSVVCSSLAVGSEMLYLLRS